MATRGNSRKPSPRPTTEAAGGDAPEGSRFIIANRLAPYGTAEARTRARDRFMEKLTTTLGAVADLGPLKMTAGGEPAARQVLLVEIDPKELAAKQSQLSPDSIIEPELPRQPAVLGPRRLPTVDTVQAAGAGAALTLAFTCEGHPLPAASVNLGLLATDGSGNSNSLTATSDGRGVAAFQYDATKWIPVQAFVEPRGRAWSQILVRPWDGQSIDLKPLPESGPLGWWHRLGGAVALDPTAGGGVTIGIADTGLGPHPYLQAIEPLGAFINGGFEPGAAAAADVEAHGTHVAGIIGAQPPADGHAFAGLVPAARILAVRVFGPDGSSNQGDIANAIDALGTAQADLINLSLGGAPSAIEYDAVLTAFLGGSLCICAAGNNFGQPVLAPASYPLSVAISALGMRDTFPATSMASLGIPKQPDHFTGGGLYLAAYSNIGPQIAATAGGSAVISTVPQSEAFAAPYADMSGTSMATPVVTAALAARLSRDSAYLALPRNQGRAQYARMALGMSAVDLGLARTYQGAGLARS